MPRKRRKKQGVRLGWLRIVAMAVTFFLAVSFFTEVIKKFLEQSGGISTTGLIFGLTPVHFYLLMLFLMVICFAALAGSYQKAREELFEKLD